jgi:TRAP-type C4-dicarboxylate transport system permease small subunit
MTPSDLLDKADMLLKGEPARAIGYGAALVIVGVSLASNALGFTRIPAVDLPTAVTDATFAIGTVVGLIESIRHFVYSQNTVQAIATRAADTGDDTIPPPPADGDTT